MSAIVRNLIDEARAAEIRENERIKQRGKLIQSLVNDNNDVTKTLIEALGKNKDKVINWRDSDSGNSILHTMVYTNSTSQIKLLLENGADIEAINNNGETPLHWAIKTNSLEATIVLLDNNANINAKDLSNSTPLHYAAMGIPEMVSLLLRRGADDNCRDNDGKTALDLAMEGDNEDFIAIKVLLQRNKNDIKNNNQIEKKKNIKTNNDIALLSLQSINLNDNEKRQINKPIPKLDMKKSISDKNLKIELSPQKNNNSIIMPVIDNNNNNNNNKLQRAESEPMMITVPLSVLKDKNIDISEFLPPTTTTKKKKQLHEPNVRYLSSSAIDKIRTMRMMKKTKPPGPVFAIRGIIRPLNEKFIDSNPPADHFNFNTTLVVKGKTKILAFAPALLGLPTVSNPNLDPSSTADFSKFSGKVSSNIEYMFTEPSYIPYLPLTPTHGDIFICIEQCSDCSSHGYCLWHDEDRYNSCAEHYLVQLIKLIYKKAPSMRVYAYKVKPDRCRVGAFEISVATYVDINNSEQWIVNTIFSKLHSLTWPTDASVLRAIELFLNIYVKEFSPLHTKVENIQKIISAGESTNLWGQKLFGRDDIVSIPKSSSRNKVSSKGNVKGSSNKNLLQKEVIENIDPFLPLERNVLHTKQPEELLEWDKQHLHKYLVCDFIDRNTFNSVSINSERARTQSLEGSIEKDENEENEDDTSISKTESLTNI